MRFYLGVDGGQSSTTALIADESGAVLGTGRDGPCNHVHGPEAVEKFNRVIGGCVGQACRQAGLAFETIRFSAACFGFSGGPEDKHELVAALIQSERYHVTHDAEVALSGATAGEPGIIVIAGTGSMAFGRNTAGQVARAGGWGYVFGDEGGAFDLVRQAVRACLRAEEGWGTETSLRPQLLEATGTSSANALLHAFYTAEYPRAKVATFAPLIDRAAQAGDEVANRILQQAGAQLAAIVRAVYGQLFKPDERIQVSPIGGAFSSSLLRRYAADEVRSATGCTIAEPKWSPAAGALLQALRADGNHNIPRGMDLSCK